MTNGTTSAQREGRLDKSIQAFDAILFYGILFRIETDTPLLDDDVGDKVPFRELKMLRVVWLIS